MARSAARSNATTFRVLWLYSRRASRTILDRRFARWDLVALDSRKLHGEHVADGNVDTVLVPNLSRLSRDRKERLRLLLDVDGAGVAVHSVELGRAVDLDDDWALVHQSIRATTDDVEKRKEIERSKRATHERIENGYDHGRPPFGLTYDDSGRYWIPDRDSDEYRAALACISLRENGHSWREIARKTSVNKDTARRIYTRCERYLPANERGGAALETVR